MRKRLNITFILFIVICNSISAQERDSTLNTDTMFYYLYSDTADWEDFKDDSILPNGTIFQTTGQRKACRDKVWKFASANFNLCNENPYVLIFHDEFKTFDENMWFQKNSYGLDWNWWNSDAAGKLCVDDPMKGQQLYMRENVATENGNLMIKTRPISWAVPWCGKSNSMWPWGSSCADYHNENFYYTSGRAQTSWAFSRGEDFSGDGIIVQARIKVPDKDGLWPAFWLTNIDGGYDEFDIFEFMDNEWNKLKMTIHADNDLAHDQCREEYTLFHPNTEEKRREFFDEFHTFTFFYTDYSMAVFLDDKLVWEKHHVGRHSGLWHFDCDISKNEFYGTRQRYCQLPMRIAFNTHVYCTQNANAPNVNSPISANMEVEYVNVWRKLACNSNKELKTISDLKLNSKEYNVIAAKEIVVNMNTLRTKPYDIDNGDYLKLLANDIVEINNITVDPENGRLDVEITKNDLCKDAFDFKPLKVNRRSINSGSTGYNGMQKNPENNTDSIKIVVSNSEIKLLALNIDNYVVRIFDFSGRSVAFNSVFQSKYEMHISTENISTGVYTVTLISKFGKINSYQIFINEN
ncbi:MAG: family 16 glycosylhydrolase [Bacteroidia bacterium]|nr:family 16 glycosylhydrolase [Bacteroidia bacterium]